MSVVKSGFLCGLPTAETQRFENTLELNRVAFFIIHLRCSLCLLFSDSIACTFRLSSTPTAPHSPYFFLRVVGIASAMMNKISMQNPVAHSPLLWSLHSSYVIVFAVSRSSAQMVFLKSFDYHAVFQGPQWQSLNLEKESDEEA